jgi:murein DD-endopeptidase MepM/ murein hydrolase activator NlpD
MDEDPAVYVGADQVDSYLEQTDDEAWFRPRQTPAPTPQPAPPVQPTQPTHPTPPQSIPQIETPAEPEPEPEPEPPAPPPEPVTFEPFSEDDRMVWPVYGDVIMPFSVTSLIFDPTFDRFSTNDNLRISAQEGDPVRVGADGRVVAIGTDFWRGNYVTIDHGDGWTSTFGQLMENVLVSEGDIVRTGQVLGGVGRPSMSASLNGAHVHLHVTHNDQPVDPYELLQLRE